MADENQATPKKNKFNPTELGATGLKVQAGMIFEEVLKDLVGMRKYKTYSEMADNSPVIGAIIFAIESLIEQVEWRVEAFSDSPQHQEDKDFIESNMQDMEQPWCEVISEINTALVNGFAPLEQVFKVRRGEQPLQLNKAPQDRTASSRFNDGKIGWKKLSLRSQDTIHRWELADNGDIIGLWQIAPPQYKNVFIPIEKLLLFRTTTKKNNPEGRSILRNAFRPWFYGKNAEKIEAIGMERDLAGLPVMWAPPEIMATDAAPELKAIYEKLKDIVQNVRRDEQEGVIMPQVFDDANNPLYKFELLSTGGTRQFDTNKIITRYDARIAMSVLADFVLLGHDKVGSFNMAETKTGVFTTAMGSWLGKITEVFNRVGIPMLFRLNGMPTDELPKLSHGGLDNIDTDKLGAYVLRLSQAGIDMTGEKASEYLKAQGGLPLEDE